MLVLLGQPQNLLLKSPWMSTPIRSVTMHIPTTPFSGESSSSGKSRCIKPVSHSMHFLWCAGVPRAPLDSWSSPPFEGSGPGRTAWTPPSAFCHRSDPPAPVRPHHRRSPTSSLPAVVTRLLETALAASDPRLPLGWRGRSKANLCLNPTVGVRLWQDASALLCPHTPAQGACSGRRAAESRPHQGAHILLLWASGPHVPPCPAKSPSPFRAQIL